MADKHSRLSKSLKNLRAASGKTLREVERATGLSNELVCQIESGHVKSPGVFTVYSLATCYGVSMDQLLACRFLKTK